MSTDLRKMPPQCDGPKLHAFSNKAVDIQFDRLLSDNEQIGQSHVFEVLIDGVRYALKVFKFRDVDTATFTMNEDEIEKVPIKTIIHFHPDPFYNERRVPMADSQNAISTERSTATQSSQPQERKSQPDALGSKNGTVPDDDDARLKNRQ